MAVTFAITLSGEGAMRVQGVSQLNDPTLTTVPLRVRLVDKMDMAQGLPYVVKLG